MVLAQGVDIMPISSTFLAMATEALMRSFSVGVRPVVGSVVMSLTLNTPICMMCLSPCPWSRALKPVYLKIDAFACITAGNRTGPGFVPGPVLLVLSCC